MLVLTRRVGETLMIGDPLKPEDCYEVQVVETRGEQVRIGVSAPRAVTVDRSEIWEQKRQEQKDRLAALAFTPGTRV